MQEAVMELVEAVSGDGSVVDLCRLVRGIVGRFMPARNFFILLYDDAAKMVAFPFFVDEYDPIPDPFYPRPLGDGLIEYILRTEKALHSDREGLEDLAASGVLTVQGTVPSSIIAIPLRPPSGRIMGVIAVQSYDSFFHYSAGQRDVLQALEPQIALAIQRKNSFEALQKSEEKYRAIFQRSAVPLLEVDIAYVRIRLKKTRRAGVTNLQAHLAATPSFIPDTLLATSIVDLNDAAISLLEADSRGDLLGPLSGTFGEEMT
jgi:GAF domain-containing protein